MAQCEAKSKQSGERCKRSAVPGRSVCTIHGGKSLAGVAAPSIRHGRYSRHLPERLLERYTDAANDPELLSIREDVALLESRLAELLERVDAGGTTDLWVELEDAWDSYQRKRGSKDADTARHEVDRIIKLGGRDALAWSEIVAVIEQKRKLSESERKRLVDMQQLVTTNEAMLFVAAIVDAVRRHVSDRDTLAAISADIARLTHVRASG